MRSALELLSAAFALHPGFAESEITELCAGLRSAYPDNLPRVEWHGGVLRVKRSLPARIPDRAGRGRAGDRGDGTMHVLVNGDRNVVVAVNERFVAKTEWPSSLVRNEDRLDILSAMQGG